MFRGCPYVFQTRLARLLLVGTLAFLAAPVRSATDTSKREITEALGTVNRFLKSPAGAEWLAKRSEHHPFTGSAEEILKQLSEATESTEEVRRAAQVLQSAPESAEISLFLPANPSPTDGERKFLSSEEEPKIRNRRSDVVCLQDHDVIAVTRTAYDWQWFLRKVIPAYTVHLALDVSARGSRQVICLERTPVYLPKSRRTSASQVSTIMDVAKNLTTSADSAKMAENGTNEVGSRSNTDPRASETPAPPETAGIDAKLLQEEDEEEGVEEDDSEEGSSCTEEEDKTKSSMTQEAAPKDGEGENDYNTEEGDDTGEEHNVAEEGNLQLSKNDGEVDEQEHVNHVEGGKSKVVPESKEDGDVSEVHDWIWDIDNEWDLPPAEWWNVTEGDWGEDIPVIIEQVLRKTNPAKINDLLSAVFAQNSSSNIYKPSTPSPRRSMEVGNQWPPMIRQPEMSKIPPKEQPCNRPIILVVPSPRIVPVGNCRYPCVNPLTGRIVNPRTQGIYPSTLMKMRNDARIQAVQDLLRRRKILLANYLAKLRRQRLIRKLLGEKAMRLRQRSKLRDLLLRREECRKRAIFLRRLNALWRQMQTSRLAFTQAGNPPCRQRAGIMRPQRQRLPLPIPTKIPGYHGRQRPSLTTMAQFGCKSFPSRPILSARPLIPPSRYFKHGILPKEMMKIRADRARLGLYNSKLHSLLSNQGRLPRSSTGSAKIKDQFVRKPVNGKNQRYFGLRNIIRKMPLRIPRGGMSLGQSRFPRLKPMSSRVVPFLRKPYSPRAVQYYVQRPRYGSIIPHSLRNGRGSNANKVIGVLAEGNKGGLTNVQNSIHPSSPSTMALALLRNPRAVIRGGMFRRPVPLSYLKALANRPRATSVNSAPLYSVKPKPVSLLNQPRLVPPISPTRFPNPMSFNLTPRDILLAKRLWQILANQAGTHCQPQTCYSPCQTPCNKPVKIHISVKGPVNEPIRLSVRSEPNEAVEIVPENSINFPNFNRRSMQPLQPEEANSKDYDFVLEDEADEKYDDESNAIDEAAEKILERMRNGKNVNH